SRNNEDFKNFLNTKTKNTEFFIYFCSIDLPEYWKDRLIKYEVKVHRFTKPNDDKCYTIDQNAAEGIVVVKGSHHIFLPLNVGKFKLKCTSRFPTFLKDYSKNVKCDQQQIDCKENYKGLIKYELIKYEKTIVKFNKITFSSNNSRLELRDELFGELVDGPLLLCSNGKEYAVGWCAKARDNNSKITWYKFKPQGSDITEIWKASCDQPDSVQPAPEGASSTSQPAPEGASSTSQPIPEGASSSSQPTPEGASSTSQPTPEGASSTSQPTPQGASIAGPPIQEPSTLMKDLIQTNSKVKDCLKNGLDYEYRLLSNWRHLADQLKDPAVPQEVKEACESGTIHSPTWEVLGRPDICIKPVQDLMNILSTGPYARIDVIRELSKEIPEAERSKCIQDVLLNKIELMDRIAGKLDVPADIISKKNWFYLGQRLGIHIDDLELIKRGNNPAEKLLLYVYRTLPQEKKSAAEFRRIIMSFDDRVDLHNFVTDVLKIKENDDARPLIDIIQPDSNEMKKVTSLLNKSTGGIKNWRTLAREWKLDFSVYDTFDPLPRPSPTGRLLEWMCTINSHVSVEVFLNILGEKMKRYDIKEELEKIIQN
ncbi:hypothetical protein AC249_AIPGENE20874, partial [Exaiptasia diaphana]